MWINLYFAATPSGVSLFRYAFFIITFLELNDLEKAFAQHHFYTIIYRTYPRVETATGLGLSDFLVLF